jgi:hypothetical protein
MTTQIKDPGAATPLRQPSHGDVHAVHIRALLKRLPRPAAPSQPQADEEATSWR